MSQVMRTVKIPECMNPFYVEVNGHKYSYPAGTTQEVPEEVAAVIEAHEGNHHHGRSGPVHNQSLNIQADWNVNDPGDLRFIKNKPSGGGNGGGGADLLDGNGIIKQEYLPDDIGNCVVKPFPPAIQSASLVNDGVIVVTELENNTFYYLDVSDSEFNQYYLSFGFSNGTSIGGANNVQKRCIYFHERGEPNASGTVCGHVYGNNCTYDYSIDAQGNVTGSGHGNSEYLRTKTFNTAYTPTNDYHPATKKYVDDTALKVANEAVANIVFPDVEKGNWNQNDPEAADYIKNRTHYVEYGDNLVEILPAASLALNEENGAFMLLDAIELTAGKQYVVKFTDSSNNEVEYTTMCVDAPENEDGMKWMLGDAGLMEGTPTTGEPFIMIVLDPSVVPQIGFGAMVMWIGGTVLQTISISAQEEIVHKLDPKYLPGKVVYYWDGESMKVTDADGNAITAEQAARDMFNVVIYDTAEAHYWIPYGCVDEVSYVMFNFLKWGETQDVYAGTVPK